MKKTVQLVKGPAVAAFEVEDGIILRGAPILGGHRWDGLPIGIAVGNYTRQGWKLRGGPLSVDISMKDPEVDAMLEDMRAIENAARKK